MVPRPLAPAQAMRSRTCAHVFQPCLPNYVLLNPGLQRVRLLWSGASASINQLLSLAEVVWNRFRARINEIMQH